ncbi:Highly reducing polyketide synthase gloL [Cladobotryum mycophilum]|uniref:Highly reducing polyketide synthase gloL n=1 Tax=Cladobotryum mycophilum TaxID=491253 RepID=A0ABR0SN00_9HYPO
MDVDGPDALVSAIVSRPATTVDQMLLEVGEITIMCLDPQNDIPKRLSDELASQGTRASFITLGDTPIAYQPIISTVALESEGFDAGPYLEQLQTFFSVQSLTTALWLLPPSQIECQNPHSAELLGLVKGVSAEMSLPNFTLQISPSENAFNQLVGKVLRKVVVNAGPGDVVGEDKHFLVNNGTIMVSRYQPFLLEQETEKASSMVHSENVGRWLQPTSPGALSSLAWIEQEIPGGADGLAADEIEVDVNAIGLNFRDVLFALGIIKTDASGLGFEGAGVIRKVGSDVVGLTVGDRVAFVTNDCTWTRMRLPAAVCGLLPDNWSFEEAATIPITFMTVMHALIDVAQLMPGQSVLIHSACGGVGHAAIQLCQLLEAEVFVTVGNEDKVRYVHKELGIPMNRIFNSRDDSFVSGIMRETNGQGVDVVLNSLSGNLLHASWNCVAEFGKMIELGKRDAQGFAKLSLEAFLSCRTYSSIDVLQLLAKRPKQGIRLFQRVMQLCSSGKILPIPHQAFSASEVELGFRTLQRGAHIGKLVISIPQSPSKFEAVAARNETKFDPNASYLLTGGLGGLGKSMATWMAERGARDFVFLSPSAGSTSHSAYIRELESMGCKVHPVSGKVEEIADVKTALAAARGPIKGVVHLAMKLKDMSFQSMLPGDWSTVMAPKADGAINLHQSLLEAGQDLDFFILTSSMAGVMETPGQANYHASNSFLESFAQYRRSIGLPASVIVLPAIGDVGYVAADERLKRYFAPQNAILYEKDLIKYLEHAVRNQMLHSRGDERQRFFGTRRDDGVVYMGLLSPTSLNDVKCQTAWRYDPRMGSYHNAKDKAQSQATGGSLKSRMAKILSDVQVSPSMLKEDETILKLATLIGGHLFSLMMREETAVENFLEQPFRQMGLDSMVLLELRGWWAEAIGIPISPVELAGKTNLKELGECAAGKLYKRFSSV